MKKKYFIILLGLSCLLTACDQKVENKEVSIIINSQNIISSFSGTLKNGKPEGEGYISVNAERGNWSYNGLFSEGNISGVGVLQDYPINATFSGTDYDGKYTGNALNGVPDGNGKFIYKSDDISISYDGSWKESMPYGKGHLISNNFTVAFNDVNRIGEFDGETLNGIANGQGKFKATNGNGLTYTYTGEWKDNIFNGQGKRIFDGGEGEYEIGTYVNGDYQPTKAEFIAYMGTYRTMPFNLSDKNKAFIESNEFLFPSLDDAQLVSFISPFTYEQYSKKPSDYQERLMDVGSGYITQIFESDSDLSNFETLTTIIVTDLRLDKTYYIYYFGKLENIFKGDTVSVIGLPVAYTTFENAVGGQTWCTVMVGSSIKK